MGDLANILIHAVTPSLAILSVTVMELFALSHGIDGTSLAGSMAIVGGLGGYGVTRVVSTIQQKQKKR